MHIVVQVRQPVDRIHGNGDRAVVQTAPDAVHELARVIGALAELADAADAVEALPALIGLDDLPVLEQAHAVRAGHEAADHEVLVGRHGISAARGDDADRRLGIRVPHVELGRVVLAEVPRRRPGGEQLIRPAVGAVGEVRGGKPDRAVGVDVIHRVPVDHVKEAVAPPDLQHQQQILDILGLLLDGDIQQLAAVDGAARLRKRQFRRGQLFVAGHAGGHRHGVAGDPERLAGVLVHKAGADVDQPAACLAPPLIEVPFALVGRAAAPRRLGAAHAQQDLLRAGGMDADVHALVDEALDRLRLAVDLQLHGVAVAARGHEEDPSVLGRRIAVCRRGDDRAVRMARRQPRRRNAEAAVVRRDVRDVDRLAWIGHALDAQAVADLVRIVVGRVGRLKIDVRAVGGGHHVVVQEDFQPLQSRVSLRQGEAARQRRARQYHCEAQAEMPEDAFGHVCVPSFRRSEMHGFRRRLRGGTRRSQHMLRRVFIFTLHYILFLPELQ